MALIDALKALASQLIVLHHLAFYGPMSDFAMARAPTLIVWLSQYARIAVQVFFVAGGFLAAQGLAPAGRLLTATPLSLVHKRYFKLVIPYLAALLLSIICAAIARELMTHSSIPEAPTLAQFIAHVMLLQSVLGYDGLSAGVWYIAIDFQLFVLLLSTLWLARGFGAGNKVTVILGQLLVSGLAIGSLFFFNRDAAWDNWALYFFGSYSLGVLTYWASNRKWVPAWLLLIATLVITALLVDFRSRIAVAFLVAMVLGIARYAGFLEHWPRSRTIAWLGQISYSVFLVHFPVCLIVNALFFRFTSDNPVLNLTGMFIAWVASIGAGALFYQLVENRTRPLLRRMSLAFYPTVKP
ncbi:MAG: acyltransferase family protein [Pirellulaceae bacterium]